MSDPTLDRIDATLDGYEDYVTDWHGSADSMRWSPDAELGGYRERTPVLAEPFDAVDLEPYLEAFQRSLDRIVTAYLGLAGSMVKAFWVFNRVAVPPRRPMVAAERTNSPQRRAGSRRTKRHARSSR